MSHLFQPDPIDSVSFRPIKMTFIKLLSK